MGLADRIFDNQHFAKSRQMFADQFEPDGGNFKYRTSLKAAPLHVSAAERDRFVEAFNRHVRHAIWALFAAIMILVGLLASFVTEPSDSLTYMGSTAILAAAFMGYFLWAWYAPARELRGRPPIGEPRSHAEVKRLTFARMTYGKIFVPTAVGAALLLAAFSKGDPFSGWNLVRLAVALVLILGAAIQAYRKWRFESQDGRDGGQLPQP